MLYHMRLQHKPFCRIQDGTKTIEMRLNDEKRQLLKEGDLIEFENLMTKDFLKVEIVHLYSFPNFVELYQKFDKRMLGYSDHEEANPKDMEEYYSIAEQEQFGVLAIEVKRL